MAEALLLLLAVILLALLLWQGWQRARGDDGEPPTLNTRSDR